MDSCKPETYLAHVTAKDPADAAGEAQLQAVKANGEVDGEYLKYLMDRDSFYPLLVIQGTWNDLFPG